MHRLVRTVLPGAFLVEIFPAMKRLPSWMAKWKREGLEWHRKDTEMFQGFMDGVEKTMVGPYPPFLCGGHQHHDIVQVSGEYKPSFAASLFERTDKHGLIRKE
jgi:hypothetical protein